MPDGMRPSRGSRRTKFKFMLSRTEVQEIGGRKILRTIFSNVINIIFSSFLNVHFRINRELNRNRANVISKRPTSTPQRASYRSRDQSESNQVPVDKRRRLNNEINPPEVLSTQDTQFRRKKQHNKSKERKTANLTGSVDLGMKSLKRNKATTSTTTTEHPNEIPMNFQTPPPSSNHHRHNHYNTVYDKSDYYRKTMMTSETTQHPTAYQLPSSSATITTSAPSYQPPQPSSNTAINSSHLSAISTRQIEKVNDFFYSALNRLWILKSL